MLCVSHAPRHRQPSFRYSRLRPLYQFPRFPPSRSYHLQQEAAPTTLDGQQEPYEEVLNNIWKHLKICSQEDWAKVTRLHYHHFGGWTLEYRHRAPLHSLLLRFYPALPWKHPWEPPPFFLDRLSASLSIATHSDYQSLDSAAFKDHGGLRLLVAFDYSLRRILSHFYPSLRWDRTFRSSKHFWTSPSNQRLFLDRLLAPNPNIRLQADLNLILHAPHLLALLPLGSLLGQYNGSAYRMLEEVYWELHWNPNMRRKVPADYWKSKELQGSLVRRLAEELEIRSKGDWYRTSEAQVARVHGRKRVSRAALEGSLEGVFPEEGWESGGASGAGRRKRSRQRWLVHVLRAVWPSEVILEEYHHPALVRASGSPVVFDAFLPALKVAFEYQGEQHYRHLPSAGFGSFESQRSRDNEKRSLCTQHGIAFVCVPYWWDDKEDSLKSMITQQIGWNRPL